MSNFEKVPSLKESATQSIEFMKKWVVLMEERLQKDEMNEAQMRRLLELAESLSPSL